MNYQNIKVDIEDHLYVVTINRPEVMNALNPATHAEMAHAFDHFRDNDELWVAIITGSGDTAFCAGGDISVMAEVESADDYKIPASGYGGLTNRHDTFKPIICAVNGMAYGGGMEIAMASDIVVASETASFGLPEPMIGVAAMASGMHRLVRDIGKKAAMQLLLTAEIIDAKKALSMGIINEVVPQDEVMDRARAIAHKILKCSPLAIQATKQCAEQGMQFNTVEQAMAAQESGQFDHLERMIHSRDRREGLKAFMEKRKPLWTGS